MGFRRPSVFILLSIVCCGAPVFGKETLYAPRKPQAAPEKVDLDLASFPQVRQELLSLIGKAKKRVWLVTDFLTDGDVVTALYLAKYRGVDVQVLLGKPKAQAYLSRLHDLKKQETPVFLVPEDFQQDAPTTVLIDLELYTMSTDLDFRIKKAEFSLKAEGPKAAEAFATRFGEAAGKRPAQARPMPLVGRSRAPRGAPWRPPRSSDQRRPQYQGEKNGSYNYNKSTTPQDKSGVIPRTLPKVPKYQMRRQEGQRGGGWQTGG